MQSGLHTGVRLQQVRAYCFAVSGPAKRHLDGPDAFLSTGRRPPYCCTLGWAADLRVPSQANSRAMQC